MATDPVVTLWHLTQWSLYGTGPSSHSIAPDPVVTLWHLTQWSLYSTRPSGHYSTWPSGHSMVPEPMVTLWHLTQWSLNGTWPSGHSIAPDPVVTLWHLTQWSLPTPCTVPEESKRSILQVHKISTFQQKCSFPSGQEGIPSPHIPVKVLHHHKRITFPLSFGWQPKGQVYRQLTLQVMRGGGPSYAEVGRHRPQRHTRTAAAEM